MNNFIPKNIEDFYLDNQSLKNIKLWEKSYDKPLFIYGETGCGKSSLANINKIAIETSSEIIKEIIGSSINMSNVTAIVENISKKKVEKNL